MNQLLSKIAEPSTQRGVAQAVGLTAITTGPQWMQIVGLVLNAVIAVLDILRKERAGAR